LVRCHNSKGKLEEFEAELGCLWEGFTRTTTRRKARAIRRGTEEHEDNDGNGNSDCESEEKKKRMMMNRDEFKEGKALMTPAIFWKTCMWLLQWATMEGIFGALFIALLGHLSMPWQ
jgi:hypothetical protein